MPKVSNILFVVVDALRPDRIGAYGGNDLTPNIDSIAAEAELFERCYACINATDPSMTTILSGQYPTSHGVINHAERISDAENKYAADVTLLSEHLQSSHTTIGIDILDRWHARGFDHYHNGEREENHTVINVASDILAHMPNWIHRPFSRAYQRFQTAATDVQTPYVDAPSITDTLLDLIKDTQDSWFAMTHYWDTHVPYVPCENHPSKIREREYSGDEVPLAEATNIIADSRWQNKLLNSLAGDAETVGDMKRKYDAGVVRVDNQIGRIVDFLRKTDQYDETAIIITADHGESFTEHNVFFDHHTLYEPSVHVPLIIDAPGFSGRESGFVQHFDLVPTILDLLDHGNEERFDGVSLVPDGSGRTLDRNAVFFEESYTARRRGIRTNSHKLIKRIDEGDPCRYCERHHASGDELYDLNTDADEQTNCLDDNPTVVKDLSRELDMWIESRPEPGRSTVNFESNDKVKERLEEMGYL